jgi:adenylate cyclase
MPVIRFLPDDRTAEIAEGETVLEAARKVGVPLLHACGGTARCSTCRVLIVEGAAACGGRNGHESAMAARLGFGPDVRLACQTAPVGAAATVTLRRLVLDDRDRDLAVSAVQSDVPGSAGVERRLGILFCDIRGFTAFSESVPAYDVIHVLNRWLASAEGVVRRSGGYVDNYLGDGLMALFGIDGGTAADIAGQAVRCGLELVAAAEAFSPYQEALFGRPFRIGVGVHLGEAVVGTVGTAERKRTTAIGDAVNFAARVESANKEAGTRMLVSGPVREALGPSLRVGRTLRVRVPGKTGEHELFEALGAE